VTIRKKGRQRVALVVLTAALAWPGAGAEAQELADFDYENLSFRGIGLELGWVSPDRVEPTPTYGVRLDLGYLGPGLRLTPSLTYWSSHMKRGEVRELEARLEELVDRESPPGTPPASVDLGNIDWADLVLGLDGHVVWSVPGNLLTFLGVGVAAHVRNGSGEAIRGTFVEDLLDSVTAGFNLHGGLEYPLSEQMRLYGTTRYEILGDLKYLELRMGFQFMFGPSASGEVRGR
jgi:hypothetical protein